MTPVRICFVCLGNICRSPTAEAVFRHEVVRSGLADRFEIDSAGTGDWHVGELAHPTSRETARARGFTIDHRARQFVRSDFARFDWILAMDASNHRNLTQLANTDAEKRKIHMFRSFESDASGLEVPDPYYTGQFDLVFDICERASRGLLSHLREVHELA